MESFYPKFGEVELVLVEDDNDFYDPLESNFECEDDNEDVKLQLNDTIHEESQFNLDIDDDTNASSPPPSPVQVEHSGFGRKPSIKQEILDQNCDYDAAAAVNANNNFNHKNNRPIIAPKFECDVDASEDSLDANNSQFFGNNSDNDSDYEDNTPLIELKPNLDELRLQAKKMNSTQSSRCTESTVPTPGNSHNTNEVDDVKQSVTEKKVNQKRSAKLERVTAQNGNDKVKNKRKPRAKTKNTTETVASTATATTTATVTAVDADSTAATTATDAVAADVKVNATTISNQSTTIVKPKDRSKRKSTDPSTRHYSKRNEIPKNAIHNEAYDKKLLFCKICSIQFDRSPTFTEHMRDEHSIDKPFECFICSKAYRISSLLAEHIRYHFGEKPYGCQFCDRRFSQLQPYKAHIRKAHTKERPYQCNFVDENNVKCEETFFDTKTYKFHMREHTNDQPFTCEFCSKKFNHSGTYQAHMRTHTHERPYTCHLCGKSFAQISTHKVHMLTHSDEYRFPCTECDKKFKQATNLKLHMRVHTKETPYKCEDCGRGFAQLVTYRNHRRIHTGEKPFKCTYDDCDKAFRHRNSFRRHLQCHTGEKPFQCNICFKRLSQTSSYVAHMRRHERLGKS